MGGAVQLQADDDAINDNDLIHKITTGGGFCLGLATMGGLEVWAGPLLGGRLVVVLFNRSPSADVITAKWSDIGAEPRRSYVVFDVWAAESRGSFTGSYSTYVEAHVTMLLV